MKSENYFTLSFTLEDRYGDNGLICAIVLEKLDENSLFIDTWLMSCRVLKRGMEDFTLNKIVELAQENGFKKIIGEFLPSSKNQMVENHYQNLGFTFQEGLWILKMDDYINKEVYINKKNNTHE